jgi:hypothetical protein
VPAVAEDQIRGVAFNPVTGADFDAQLAADAEDGEQKEQNSILIGLGIALEADLAELWKRAPFIEHSSICQHEVNLSDWIRPRVTR